VNRKPLSGEDGSGETSTIISFVINCHLPSFSRLRAHGGCDRSSEDAYSSTATDPTFAFVGGPCCPTLDFVITFLDYDYILHIVNFAILYFRVSVVIYARIL
jgi:hypothetical protein